MTELEELNAGLTALLKSLDKEHLELEKTTNEIQVLQSEETVTMNNILHLSEKIRLLTKKLEDDYLEK